MGLKETLKYFVYGVGLPTAFMIGAYFIYVVVERHYEKKYNEFEDTLEQGVWMALLFIFALVPSVISIVFAVQLLPMWYR